MRHHARSIQSAFFVIVSLCLSVASAQDLVRTAPRGVYPASSGAQACFDDPYEPDNNATEAKLIAPGETQSHLHCDPDWVAFNGVYGNTFVVETKNLAGGADTVLQLYEILTSDYPERFSLVASDDNGGGGGASRLVYTLTSGWSGNGPQNRAAILEAGDQYGPGKSYDVSVRCIANCPGVPHSLFVPAAVHLMGRNGTLYETDLALFNNGSSAVDVELLFTPTDTDGRISRLAKTLTVRPGAVQTVVDIVSSLFDVTGSGSIEIRFTGAISADSRTYNATSGGTYGELVPAEEFTTSGGVGDPLHLVGLSKSASRRTNVGLCETTGGRVPVLVKLFDQGGLLLGSKSYELLPWGHHQIDDVFGALGVDAQENARVTVEATSRSGRVLAYATVIANETGDFFYARPQRPIEYEDGMAFAMPGGAHRAQLWLANPGIGGPQGIPPASVRVDVAFRPYGTTTVPSAKSFDVPAGTTLVLDDAVAMLGGSGTGFLVVSATNPSLIGSGLAFSTAGAKTTLATLVRTSSFIFGYATIGNQTTFLAPSEGAPLSSLALFPNRNGSWSVTPRVTLSSVSADGELLGTKPLEVSASSPSVIEDLSESIDFPHPLGARLEIEPTVADLSFQAFGFLFDPSSGDATAVPGITLGPRPDATLGVDLPGSAHLRLQRIPAGAFEMGSPENERDRDGDEAQHTVTLTRPTYLGRTEITEAEWNAVMGLSGGSNLPIVSVSWDQIAGPGGFLERLNAHLRATNQAGAGSFRLPTEAEWEFAARGGTATRFSFYDSDPACDGCSPCPAIENSLWWCANGGSTGPSPVAHWHSDRFGLHDTSGNAWEWVADWHAPFTTELQTNPKGPVAGSERVIRGGGWNSELKLCRSANRFSYPPSTSYNYVGFRVAASYP